MAKPKPWHVVFEQGGGPPVAGELPQVAWAPDAVTLTWSCGARVTIPIRGAHGEVAEARPSI